MQPEFISLICTPESLRKPPSMAISPNSFSISTIFSPVYASAISFLISVVLPAPRKPEKISIFVIKESTSCLGSHPKILSIIIAHICERNKSGASRKQCCVFAAGAVKWRHETK